MGNIICSLFPSEFVIVFVGFFVAMNKKKTNEMSK